MPPLYDVDGEIAVDAFDGPYRQFGIQVDDNDAVNLSIAQAEQLARLIRPAMFYSKAG